MVSTACYVAPSTWVKGSPLAAHLGALRFPHLRVGVCWASSAPTFLPLWPTRLDLPVRLLVCSLDVLCLPQRAVWCARASTAAYPAVGLPVVVTAIAVCDLAGSARCCPRPFSCRASIPFPWHASFPLVPRFASPRIVAWLFALDVSARPHCWLLLCVPTIIAFIGSSFASMARPSRWLLTCGSRFGSPWHVSPLFWAALFNYYLYLSRFSTPSRIDLSLYLFVPLC
ncbi:hypothetical protein V6N13_083088 [Hibiscus sabdariffa]